MGKATKNFIFNTANQVLAIVVSLVTAPYLARILGPDNVGVEGYVLSVSQIFYTIGMIGLMNYSSREIAYCRDDHHRRTVVFWELTLARVILFLATAAVYMAVAVNSQYRVFLLIQLVWIFAMFMDFSWFFAGLEQFSVTVVRNTIVRVLTVICVFVFVKRREDLAVYLAIYAGSQLIGTLSMVPQLKRRLIRIKLRQLRIRRHFIPTIKVFLPQLAGVLYLQIDKVMIEKLSAGVREVGYYGEAEKLIKAPLAVITAISMTLMPRVANEFIKKNMENVKHFLGISLRFSALLAFPMMFGMAGIAGKMVPWFFGEGYEPVVIALSLLAITIVPIAFSSVSANQFYIAMGQTRMLTISYTWSAAINLVINALLIPKFGFVGAAIGTIAAELTAVIIQFAVMNRSVKIMGAFLRYNIKYCLFSAVMCIAVLAVGQAMDATIMTTVLQTAVGAAVYLLLLLVTKDDLLLQALHKIFHRKKESP